MGSAGWAFLLLFATLSSAEQWSVVSPGSATTITVSLQPDGGLSWRVARRGRPVMAGSPLGIRRADQAFLEGMRPVAASRAVAVDERYRTPHGKRREHHVRGRQRTLLFRNAAGARLEVVLRAHDDGVAFRYRFPETDGAAKTVVEERTGFRIPGGSTGWMLPHHEPSPNQPSYEDLFLQVSAGTPAPSPAGWSFPALFKTTTGQWLLLTEAALDEGYCGTRLAAGAPGGLYRLRFPDPGEGLGVGEVSPKSNLPWTMPWRVVILGETAPDILESDLVSDLSPGSRVSDTSWVQPGRASWSWWSESDSPRDAARLKAFVDLAAEMAWEYSLVDANWTEMRSGRIEDVLAHARAKGVGLLFWYNSGGPHTERTQQPRDRMHVRDVRRAEFARLKEWGVKGVKVDYWHSDKQDRIRQYREVLEDAADFELLVNFHGCTLPRGWSREFPHLVTMEGVFGAEQYKFREIFAARAAWLNTVLPFTRNVVGPMDYTPVTFSDAKYPRRTTNAHELAQAVIFESGVQHFADSVEAYRALPEAPKAFLRQVPAAWDETRALAGYPGRSVVVARRDRDIWYVGGLNGQDAPETARVEVGRLGRGPWSMTLIRDGAEDRSFEATTRRVTSQEAVEVPMRPRGGFVLRLVRE